MANFGAADIARLDRAYSTPQIVDQRHGTAQSSGLVLAKSA